MEDLELILEFVLDFQRDDGTLHRARMEPLVRIRTHRSRKLSTLPSWVRPIYAITSPFPVAYMHARGKEATDEQRSDLAWLASETSRIISPPGCGLNQGEKTMEWEVIKIDPGRTVLCDFCDKNFTESDHVGGLLFQSKAAGPCCAVKIEVEARRYGEERFIRGRCPPDMAFADWVRDEVRS